MVRDLLTDTTIRYVWRHLPLTDVHPNAQLAAEAAEAAGHQGAFWEMHDLLLQHQDELRLPDLVRHATSLNLNLNRFREDLRNHTHATRVAQDLESADLSGVSGTPTFFINGQRHYGAFDLATLSAAIRTERDQLTTVRSPWGRPTRAARRAGQPGRVNSRGRTSRPTRSISRGPAGRRPNGG